MQDDWPRITNKQEEEMNRVANMLFSKGLAASLWDAKERARDIVGLNPPQKMGRAPLPEPKVEVDSILKGAGINTEQLIEAAKKEAEQNQQVIDAAMKQYKESVFTDALPMDKKVSELMEEPQPTTEAPEPVQQEETPQVVKVKTDEEENLYKDFEG
ncbi:MAG: hypothetical protein Q7S65_06465 [Nanoarchaeota archaeon]|nr:hypothetical protein [Nanoarchaeota archaeon]